MSELENFRNRGELDSSENLAAKVPHIAVFCMPPKTCRECEPPIDSTSGKFRSQPKLGTGFHRRNPNGNCQNELPGRPVVIWHCGRADVKIGEHSPLGEEKFPAINFGRVPSWEGTYLAPPIVRTLSTMVDRSLALPGKTVKGQDLEPAD